MPCKVADLIDVIFSHNERVGIWVEYRNGDESGCALLWKGMAHELPRQHLNSRFVRIFGLIPETIMDADIINIIVEIPTPMTTSEPTTGEIARALRFCYESEEIECYECPCRVSGGVYLCHMDKLADRLESQEQTIAGMKEFHEKCCGEMARAHVEEVTALTARAEQAEKQRDEAWDALDKRCEECFYSYDPKDETCIECAIGVWRGLPQEGEGK